MRSARAVTTALLLLFSCRVFADCGFTAMSAASGVAILADWRFPTAVLAGFTISSLAVLGLLLGLGRGRGRSLPAAVAAGFERAPRRILLGYLAGLSILVPCTDLALARLAPSDALRIETACYPGLQLFLYPQQQVAYFNRDWPSSLKALPSQGPGAARELFVPVGQAVVLRAGSGPKTDLVRRWLGQGGGQDLRLRFDSVGEFRGICDSLCAGISADNPLQVRAVATDRFRAWLAGASTPQMRDWAFAEPARLLADGERIYRRRCAACHGERGEGSGAVFPGLRGSAMLRGPLAGHVLFVWYGRPGSPMKAFRDELGLYEMAAVTSYQRHEFGAEPRLVQAAEIQALLVDH